jgi:hypothetical protein
MRILISYFLLFFSLITSCYTDKATKFIGKKFTNHWTTFSIDENFRAGSGMVDIPDSKERFFLTTMVLKDGRFLTLLTKLTDSSNIHSPEIIIDAITEKMPKGATSCFCYYKKNNPNKASYRSIIAIAKKEDVEVYTDIKKAWKINTKLKRFEEIPVKDIECVNDGYGV